ILSARASSLSRAVIGRNRDLDVAPDCHAEPMLVGVNQRKFCAEGDIARSVRRLTRTKHRPAQTIKALKVDLAKKREFGIVARKRRIEKRPESSHLCMAGSSR